MNSATLLCAFLLGAGLCAAAGDQVPPAIACNLKAISSAKRPHYHELAKRLRSAVLDRNELPDGYAFTLNGEAISLLQVAEWISMERLCCPFLAFQLSTSGHEAGWRLGISGPPGVRDLLLFEFPEPPRSGVREPAPGVE